MKSAVDHENCSSLPDRAAAMAVEAGKATAAMHTVLQRLDRGAHLEVREVSAAFLHVQRAMELRKHALGVAERMPAELAPVFEQYRAVLFQWKRQLPQLRGWLLAERARLSARQAHAGSVQTWIETDRQTL